MAVSVVVPVRSLTITVQQSNNQNCNAQQRSGSVSVAFSSTKDRTLAVGTIVIQNGPTQAHIDVSGSDASPSDGGKHWTLCGGTGQTCTGNRGRPGRDQFQNASVGGTKKPTQATILTYAPQCDSAYDLSTGTFGCAANPGQTAGEGLNILVASNSTDASKKLTTLISWTAVA